MHDVIVRKNVCIKIHETASRRRLRLCARASPTPAASAPQTPSLDAVMDEDLPRAHVRKILRAKLASLPGNIDPKGVAFEPNIQKDALTAASECAKIFIHYLTATANDTCRDAKRSTVSAEDVLAAIVEIDFGEMCSDVEAALGAFRTAKRRKADARADDGTGDGRGTGENEREETGEDGGEDAGEDADGAE